MSTFIYEFNTFDLSHEHYIDLIYKQNLSKTFNSYQSGGGGGRVGMNNLVNIVKSDLS